MLAKPSAIAGDQCLPLLEKGMGYWPRQVVAGITRAVLQDSIHNHHRMAAAVDRTVGNACGNADPGGFVFPQRDSAQLTVLQHDQIERRAAPSADRFMQNNCPDGALQRSGCTLVRVAERYAASVGAFPNTSMAQHRLNGHDRTIAKCLCIRRVVWYESRLQQ